jgi:hypothetical protein
MKQYPFAGLRTVTETEQRTAWRRCSDFQACRQGLLSKPGKARHPGAKAVSEIAKGQTTIVTDFNQTRTDWALRWDCQAQGSAQGQAPLAKSKQGSTAKPGGNYPIYDLLRHGWCLPGHKHQVRWCKCG